MQHMAPFSPVGCLVQDTLPLLTVVPAPACTSPRPGAGTGMGTLPLCRAVMRFLLGCLDRKSQPQDAKSLSEPLQPPAHGHPGGIQRLSPPQHPQRC